MTYQNFEEMEIWQLARKLSFQIFQITSKGKFSNDFRFRDQIRAAAGSIMDNISEGFERSGNKEFIQFLYIAKGSCGETRSQLFRALDYGYIDEDTFKNLSDSATSISKNIAGFISYLKTSEIKGYKYR
ncbi:MAG TPA: four helix bundle protein [Lentimicrobium sp.]|nr:four helix bundle protein [Lentimicrobium sp.]